MSEPLTEADVIEALHAGLYRVCPDTATVTGPRGWPVKAWVKEERGGRRRFVRLHINGRRRGISLARLVWISVVGVPVPEGFEIHHEDRNPLNDAWGNLICLHSLDHHKQHYGERAETEEPVPF